jgi:hypothetical protein
MVSYSSTQLLIEYYAVDDDKFIGEIDISGYDLTTINKLCPPEIEDDFEYCDSAFIEKESFLLLQNYIRELKGFAYEDYCYNIITRGVW